MTQWLIFIHITCILSIANVYSSKCHSYQSEQNCTQNECGWLNNQCVCASNNKIDFIFLIDTSNSITSTGFQQEQNWLKSFVTTNIDLKYSRIGFVPFSTEPNTLNMPLTNWTVSDLQSYIDSIVFDGGDTYTEKALNVAITEYTLHGSIDGEKIVIITTDGTASDSPCDTADMISTLNIRVIVLAVGPSLTSEVLSCLLQNVTTDYIPVTSFTFTSFNSIVPQLQAITCPQSPTSTPTFSPTTSTPTFLPTTSTPTFSPTTSTPTFSPTMTYLCDCSSRETLGSISFWTNFEVDNDTERVGFYSQINNNKDRLAALIRNITINKFTDCVVNVQQWKDMILDTALINSTISFNYQISHIRECHRDVVETYVRSNEYPNDFSRSVAVEYSVQISHPTTNGIKLRYLVNTHISLSKFGKDGVTTTFISYFILILLISFCAFGHNKNLWKCLNDKLDPVDDSSWYRMLSFSFKILHIITMINITYALLYVYIDYNINKYLYLAVCTFCILLFCIVANAYYSIRFFGTFGSSNNSYDVQIWMMKNSKFFMLFLIMSASVFQSVMISNCKMFGFSLFCMNIAPNKILTFRKINFILSTVIFDIPYLLIQIIFAVWIKQNNGTVILAFVLTTISILVNVFSAFFLMANHGQYNAKYIDIEVLLSGKEINKILKTNSLRRRWTNTLCATLKLNRYYLSVYNVLKISNGVILRVEYLLLKSNISNKTVSGKNEYMLLDDENNEEFHDQINSNLNICVDNGSLAFDIQSAFNFDATPSIKLLTCDDDALVGMPYITETTIDNTDNCIDNEYEPTDMDGINNNEKMIPLLY